MKRPTAILFLLALLQTAFAALQTPDICIIERDSLVRDTLSMFTFPLDSYLQADSTVGQIGSENCRSRTCSRGYQAVWTVEHDSLFLTDLRGCNASTSWCDDSELSLQTVFGERAVGGRIFAAWVSGNISVFEGATVPCLREDIFPLERMLSVKKGKVKKIKLLSNIKPKKNALAVEQSTPDMLLHILQQQVNWEALPPRENTWIADFVITILKNGKTSLELKLNAKPEFKAAATEQFSLALRAVRWAEYRQQGKKTDVSLVVKAEISQENKTIKRIK